MVNSTCKNLSHFVPPLENSTTRIAILWPLRTILPDCIFIVLSMTDETQRKRIKERHGEGEGSEGVFEMLSKMHKLYEKPGDGEKNAYNVDITEDMTRKDVFDKVMETLKDNCP